MKKMNLFEAISKYKKGLNGRSLKLWCEQVNKDIDNEIRKRTNKVEELKSDLVQRKEEKEIDLVDTLLNVDEDKMVTLDSRKVYSSKYIVDSIKAVKDFDESIQALEYEISTAEEAIEALNDLKKRFSEINIKTEGEE